MDPAAALPAILVFLLLLVAQAFFVMSEYAFVRVRQTQLDELAGEGSSRARLAARMSRELEGYLSATQLGVTIVSLLLGFVGEPAVARLLEPLFGGLAVVSDALFHAVSFLVAFALVTYLTVVLGELAPKYLAIQRALPLSLWCAYPLEGFYRLTYPFTWAVNRSASAVLRPFGVKSSADLDPHSAEELRMLVAASTRKGILQESERVLVGNALDFADTFVRQVMVPRTEIIAVLDDTPLPGLLTMAKEHPFTRYPVYHEDLDHIIGVIHVRDLVGRDDDASAVARDIMRKVPLVPETMRLDQALNEFRRQRSQLAIVVDEFGGTAGLVTLEDVLEELVGDFVDEFDKETPHFRDQPGGAISIDGLTPLADLRERLGIELADEPYDTVGGLVFGRLGRLARVGDTVELEGWRLQVSAVDGRRVAQVTAQSTKRKRA
ncbi:MAG: HlyC/CorC family transporter [Chloroflexi bacterium]|nr:HlyC/CorC family transporter [Chloroflexota bacterium]